MPENMTTDLKSSWSHRQWFYIGKVKQPIEYNQTMLHRSIIIYWIINIYLFNRRKSAPTYFLNKLTGKFESMKIWSRQLDFGNIGWIILYS
jgi:hypothetical protein